MPTTQSTHVDQSNLSAIHADWDEYDVDQVGPETEAEERELAWLHANESARAYLAA